MKILLSFVVAIFSFAAYADQESPLTGAEIEAGLSDHTAIYDDGTKQYFYDTGLTDYFDSRGFPDRGRWEVRDDQYCSYWEQSGWSCYDVTGVGDRITFIGPQSGVTYKGYLEEGNQTHPNKN